MVQYGHKMLSDTLGAFCITPKGERVLRNINGNSKHSKIEKIVSYEMFATKGSDREYLRLRRSIILKAIIENKNKASFLKIQKVLKANSLDESIETIKDDVIGFVNLGLNMEIESESILLKDTIADFSIPMYKDLTVKSELSKEKEIGGGSVLTKDLRELEECGFIRKFINFAKGEGESFYQLIDPFTLFSIRFIKNKKFDSWNEYINTSGYHSWRGNSFEIVCLNHINQMKAALGISGIETNEFAWRSGESEKGAQIDLIIRRKDGVINLCEMKYTNEAYSLDSDEYEKIQNRMARFQKATDAKEAIHITLVCGNGYKQSKYSGIVQNVILGDDLFEV